MEAIGMLIALAALVAAWWFTANRLAGRNWFIRHLAGSTIGVVALILVMVGFLVSGLVDAEFTSTLTSANTEASVEPADAPEASPEQTDLLASAIDEPEEDPFGPESQAVLDEFIPRMSALVNAGMEMETVRDSDLGRCGDLMRSNQAELASLRTDFSAALKALPSGQGAWHPNFEPLHNAVANLPRCVTCLPSAMPDCREAAAALGM